MKLPRKTIGFILVFLLLVLLFGCQKSEQRTSENLSLAKTETQPTGLLTLPQIELLETPKYKELKKRVKFQRAKVEELENERIKLLVI